MRAVLKRAGLISIVCAGLLLTACGEESAEEPTAAGAEAATESLPAAGKPKVVPPAGPPPKGLVKEDLVPGTGAEAKSGDELTVEYVGAHYKSGREFDSSWGDEEPYAFYLGTGEVLEGWDRGLVGMKVGGRRELIVPPDLAFGSTGGATIAPNSTLVFVVDLLAVE
jgi:peptidylprolyl isomerase